MESDSSISYKDIIEKNKSIKSLIKYFETLYRMIDIVSIDTKISKGLIQQESFSSSEELVLFFKVVLDYYNKSGYVPIDYSSTEPDKFKIKIIKSIYDVQNLNSSNIKYQELFKKLFDMVDFMFKTIKKILIKINDGYEKWDKNTEISFTSVIYPNLDILFYITFYPVFPQDLRSILHEELGLDDTEYKIIKRCNDQIIRYNSKVCNDNQENSNQIEINDFSKFDFISDEQKTFLQNLKLSNIKLRLSESEYLLDSSKGVIRLFNIIIKLRSFNK